MKKSCIFWNQQNQQRQNLPPRNLKHHVSQESKPKPFKPTIKVDYAQPQSKPLTARRYKKPVLIMKNIPSQKNSTKKLISDKINSGKFIDSQYIQKNPNEPQKFHKKGVQQAHEKYYGGKQVNDQLKNQFSLGRSRSAYCIKTQQSTKRSESSSRIIPQQQKRKVWQQNKLSIKDIIQYKHAGTYKQQKISKKCTNENTQQRNIKYKDLHQYDFRKCKQFLR